jgi:hypothetical protein
MIFYEALGQHLLFAVMFFRMLRLHFVFVRKEVASGLRFWTIMFMFYFPVAAFVIYGVAIPNSVWFPYPTNDVGPNRIVRSFIIVY